MFTNDQKKLIKAVTENYKAQASGGSYFQPDGGVDISDLKGVNTASLRGDLNALAAAGLITITSRRDGSTGVQAKRAILAEYDAIIAEEAQAAADASAAQGVIDRANELSTLMTDLQNHSEFGTFVAAIINKATQDGLI